MSKKSINEGKSPSPRTGSQQNGKQPPPKPTTGSIPKNPPKPK